jgi:hypothetical protein
MVGTIISTGFSDAHAPKPVMFSEIHAAKQAMF